MAFKDIVIPPSRLRGLSFNVNEVIHQKLFDAFHAIQIGVREAYKDGLVGIAIAEQSQEVSETGHAMLAKGA